MSIIHHPEAIYHIKTALKYLNLPIEVGDDPEYDGEVTLLISLLAQEVALLNIQLDMLREEMYARTQ